MPLILVYGPRRAGKTGVASAIAQHLAYTGIPVRLARLAPDPDDGHRADARWFASCDFAPGSPLEPLTALEPFPDGVLIAESDAPPNEVSPVLAPIAVSRNTLPPADAVAGCVAAVVTSVPAFQLPSLPAEVGGVPLFVLPEDRTLAGFAIDEIQRCLVLRVLVEGEQPPDATCDELVVAPFGSDAGQPYFRRFAAPAVVARFDRTDMHLAALAADPVCLILTGGRMPSGYTLDAAQARGVPVLLAPTDTESTVHLLEDLSLETRFRGERKLERMRTLLAATGLFERLPLPQPAG